jgi:hypothetical protein
MHVTDVAPASSVQLCKNLLATMTKSARLAPRHPRQHFLFDPDDVEFPRLDQIVQALGIEGKDAPERRAAPVIELFQVDIVQEWSRMDVDLVHRS